MLDLRQIDLLDRDLVWPVVMESLHLRLGRHLVLLFLAFVLCVLEFR